MRKSDVALCLLVCCSRHPVAAHDAAPPVATESAATVSAPASATAIATADPTDVIELEAKSQWESTRHVDIVYVPTPQKVVDEMLSAPAHASSRTTSTWPAPSPTSSAR